MTNSELSKHFAVLRANMGKKITENYSPEERATEMQTLNAGLSIAEAFVIAMNTIASRGPKL